MKHGLRDLKLAIILTLVILVLEILGGVLTNSLALLSDAAHVFMDVVALALSFGALRLAARPTNHRATFGYHRFEVFAALINGTTLIAISGLIFFNAYLRFSSPPEVRTLEMLVIAVIGTVVNVFVMLRLHGYKDLNIKGAYLHVAADTLSSLVVIVGGLWMLFTGQFIIDPILSMVIGLIILFGSCRLIRDSVCILLERTPKHIDMERLMKEVSDIDGVVDIHDVHVWSLCSNVHSLSAHVLVDRMHLKHTKPVIRRINNILKDKYNITHTTLQFECEECGEERKNHLRHR
jgi:cobalt-zinc-cadmium efflux system protein